MRSFRVIATFVALGMLVFLGLAHPPRALAGASLVVNTLSDADNGADGACSLREAIIAANNDSDYQECTGTGYGDDTITFSVSGTITLNGGLPTVSDFNELSLTIDGSGQSITVDGNDTSRFTGTLGGSLTIKLLTITNCRSGDGGAIRNDRAILTIIDSTISDCKADTGGAIYNLGELYITNSTFTGNTALTGGINALGGAIANAQLTVVVITNSTFYNNSARRGGAIFTDGSNVLVINSTFSGNSATQSGGGIDVSELGNATFKNSIIANSASGGDCAIFNVMSADSSDMDSDGSCDNATVKTSAELNLDVPASNGGPTQTIKLLAGSDAIDAGNTLICAAAVLAGGAGDKDQRGVTRLDDGLCEIGAYEIQSPTAVNVVGFAGDVGKANKVRLKWQSVTESQIAGFNVWRKIGRATGDERPTTQHGQWKKLNADLLQAKHAGSVQGARYRFQDPSTKSGKAYKYKVQVVYLDNHREWTEVVKVKTR